MSKLQMSVERRHINELGGALCLCSCLPPPAATSISFLLHDHTCCPSLSHSPATMSSTINIQSSEQFRNLLQNNKIVIADCKLQTPSKEMCRVTWSHSTDVPATVSGEYWTG